VAGGNIVGGNPVEVAPVKEASLCSRGRDVQRGASGPTSVTPWRRRDLGCCLEEHDRIACSKVSGSKPQRGQEVSASGDLQVGWAARLLFPVLIWWILLATNLPKPMKGLGDMVGGCR